MSVPTPPDTSDTSDPADRRYRNTSLRLPDEERAMLLALIDAGEVPDLATVVRESIRARYARMQVSRGAAWPEAVIPALLLGPTANGAPYTCPFTGEVLIGRVGLSILPGPVVGPYVSARFLTDESLLHPAPGEPPPVPEAVAVAPSREDGSDAAP